MKEVDKNFVGIISVLTADEVLRGVGLELMMLAEAYIYATESLDHEAVAHLGSDLYLFAKVIGSVIRAHSKQLGTLICELPEDVGAVRIRNPYFDKRSESPEDKAAGRSDDTMGEFPF